MLIDNSQADIQYAKALSHSRLVGFMKRALPISGIIVLIAFIGVSYINTVIPSNVIIDSAGIKDGKIIMNAPVLAGQNAQNQPYRMKAARAIQEIGGSSEVVLEEIEAEFPMGETEGTAFLEAKSGLLNQAKEFFTFTQPFEITTTSGLIAAFAAGEYDMKTGEFVSNADVDIKMEGAHIRADSMRMAQNGTLVSFTDNVKMIVEPSVLKKNK